MSWLIERKYNSKTHYFSAYTFTTYPSDRSAFRSEPDTAIRFERREDAEIFLKTYLEGMGCVCEHVWVAKP